MTNELSTRLLDGAIQSIYDAGREAGRAEVLAHRPVARQAMLAMFEDLMKSRPSTALHAAAQHVRNGHCDLKLPGTDTAPAAADDEEDLQAAPSPAELLRRRRAGLTHRMRQRITHVNDLIDSSWGGEPQLRLSWYEAWSPVGPPMENVFEDLAVYFKTRGWILTRDRNTWLYISPAEPAQTP